MAEKRSYVGTVLAVALIVATPLGAWAQQRTLRMPGLGVLEVPEQQAEPRSESSAQREQLRPLDSAEDYTCAEARWEIGHYAAELHIALSYATSGAFWAEPEQLRRNVTLLLEYLPSFVEWGEYQMEVCAEEAEQ